MHDSSPYDAPLEGRREVQRTRWRIIPATLLMVFGLVIVESRVLAVAAALYVRLAPHQYRSLFVLCGFVWIGVGVLAVQSSRLTWLGQWRTAVLIALVAGALGAGTMALQP